jgi:hypothetical protein
VRNTRHIREARRQRGQPFQKLEAGHCRHADVGEHEVGHHAQDRRKPFAAVMRNGHLVTAIKQLLGDQARGFTVVLDAQYFFTDFGHDPIWNAVKPNEPELSGSAGWQFTPIRFRMVAPLL